MIDDRPPAVDELVKALRPLLRDGLPLSPDLDDERLLALRGVFARSIDPDDRLSRVKALDDLLRRLLAFYPDDTLREPAQVLFGATPGVRGTTLTQRRELAARQAEYEPDHFRKRIEPKILRALAWQLHRDSQTYFPRSRSAPPPLAVSGDTPMIAVGDISAKDMAEHEEALSRLWSAVYGLRAEILRVERLKAWPYDPTEPELSQREMRSALDARDQAVEAVRLLVRRYVDTYGQRIRHGEAEFSAEGLLRLVGWSETAPQAAVSVVGQHE